MKASQDATINVPNLERFIADMQNKLPNLDYEGKRLALDILNITVWIDGEKVNITGAVDPEVVVTVNMRSRLFLPITTHRVTLNPQKTI